VRKKFKIIEFGDPVLREIAKPVAVYHHKLHSLIDSISYTLKHRDDGAALAANQIGVLKRITVIDYEHEYLEMINPEIIDYEGSQTDSEGCLSLPGFFASVTRYDRIKVKYKNREGKEFIIERTGSMSRCIQHEVDHLNGILFIDKTEDKFLLHSETKEKIAIEEVRKRAGEIIQRET